VKTYKVYPPRESGFYYPLLPVVAETKGIAFS